MDNLPKLGPQESGQSLSVVVAPDQVVPVSAVALPLPSGAATETTLQRLTLGQATASQAPRWIKSRILSYTAGTISVTLLASRVGAMG